MDAYTQLLTTVTPARFKVGQMIGATGLLLGIALAMYRRVDADKRQNYRSMFVSTVLAVFLTGVTEPLEFMFMFCALPLYVVYAVLQGCAFAMAGIIHLRLHSFGNLEFITRIPMSLQAGLGGDIINFVLCVVAFFLIGYFVAYFMIGKLNLATPGRLGNYTDDNANDAAADTKTEKKADKKDGQRSGRAHHRPAGRPGEHRAGGRLHDPSARHREGPRQGGRPCRMEGRGCPEPAGQGRRHPGGVRPQGRRSEI